MVHFIQHFMPRHAPKEETVQASDGSEGWMVRLRAPKASSTAVYPARSISEGRRLNHSARSGSTDRHSKSSPRSVSEGRRLNHPARSGSTDRHSKSSPRSVSEGRRLNHPAHSGSTGRHSKSSSPSVSDG